MRTLSRLASAARVCRAAAAALCLAAPASAQSVLQSRWRDRPILVDGSDADWSAQPGDDAGGFKAAFANDKRDLFILLRPQSQELRARLAGGDIVVWLDVSGTGVKKLGLRLRASGPGRTQADRVPDLVGPAASVAAAAVTRNDPYAARMGASDSGVFEARVPLAMLGSPLPRRLALGVESAAPLDAPAEEGTSGSGASAGQARGDWRGGDNDGDRGGGRAGNGQGGDGDGDHDGGGARGGAWQGGGRDADDSDGAGGGRYLGKHAAGGGRGASLAAVETGSALVWLRFSLARPPAAP